MLGASDEDRSALGLVRRLRARREANASTRAESYERWIELYDTFTASDLAGMRALAQSLDRRPLVSILLPLVDSRGRWLRETIESVRAQAYECWELCVADASTVPQAHAVLAEYARDDDRIRVVRPRAGVWAAWSSALSIARGELVGLLGPEDVLPPHALVLAVRAFENSDACCVYSDEDAIDESGKRIRHHFKPDWNPALFLARNLPSRFLVFRADLARRIGGFRDELERAQDWDLLLRMTELHPTGAIVHLPHVLYHRRATAESGESSASDAARRATEGHLRRTGRKGEVVPVGRHQRVRYAIPEPRPLVSVILPSTGRPDLLGPVLSGLTGRTAYDEIEVLVAVSESARPFERLGDDVRERVVAVAPIPFNYASTINRTAAQARGELLLLLNDDTEVVHDDWLEVLVGHVLQDRVGAVGARLLYTDDTVQHAGVLLGDGEAQHLYRGRPRDVAGYTGRARLAQDLSAVTGACMLVRRDVFVEVGGMDEELAVTYNDIDLCLKLRQRGWRVVYVPDAVLYHRETASFGSLTRGRKEAYRQELALMQRRWPEELEIDPMHNPNLALDAAHPERLAFPPRVAYPWQSAEAALLSAGRPLRSGT